VLMNPMGPVNALITDGKHGIRRLLEIKTRNVKFDQYQTSILGLDKYLQLLKVGEMLKTPVSFVVVYVDIIALVDISTLTNVPVAEAGRSDRPNDSRAVELCLHIPMEMFAQLPLPEGYHDV